MQDGAQCHTAKVVQDYLATNWGSEAFWPKEMWPPSSPDLNPLDFWAWSTLQDDVNSKRHPNVEALKNSIVRVWDDVLNVDVVMKACDSIERRLRKVVGARGNFFI